MASRLAVAQGHPIEIAAPDQTKWQAVSRASPRSTGRSTLHLGSAMGQRG